MASFFPARGCVYVVQDAGNSQKKGFYAVEGLTGTQSIILLQGVEQGFSDIIQPVVTLEDTKLIYTFGTDFGSLGIFGEILLGPAGGNSGGAEEVINFFQQNRMSKLLKPISVSMPGSKAASAYLQSLTVGRIDPELHVLPFMMNGLVADE